METPKNGYKQWIEILTIFEKYEPDASFVIQPEHDVIYTGCNPDIVSEDDKKRLSDLGAEPDDELECFYIYT